jgi:hypothetical protein
MRHHWAWLAVPALVAVATTSCASTKGPNDVLADRATAFGREYAVKSDDAWRLVGRTFEMAGFTDVAEHRDRQAMTARRDRSGESAATVVAAWIEPIADDRTRVAFKSVREQGTIGRAAASEEELHVRLSGLVGLEVK